jgi:hypothetical protein
MNDQPSNWKATLARCNFHLTAREIARFLRTSNEIAKAQGGQVIYKNEFASGWEKFADKPCYETAKQFLDGAPEYTSLIIVFFEGCCPDGKFYRRGVRTAVEFPLGNYRLDMLLQEVSGLRELTKQEYAVFGRASLQEVIYHATPVEFVGHSWNMMVGTIEGKIYRLAASLAFSGEEETTRFIENVYEKCEFFLGTPTEEERGCFIWDTETGKVIFQYAVIQETNTFAANLFVGDRGNQRYGNS